MLSAIISYKLSYPALLLMKQLVHQRFYVIWSSRTKI